MRIFLQLGFALRRSILGILRIPTTGVKVMLFNPEGEILLIRNSYGDTSQFLLPGGGVSRRESPVDAAIREMREELGVEIGELKLAGTYQSRAEGKRDTIHLFRAEVSVAIEIDAFEVVEARFFDPKLLPENVSPATARRIAEILGERAFDHRW